MKLKNLKYGSKHGNGTRRASNGFTLIEVITTMVIMSVIGVMFVDAMVNAAKTFSLFAQRKESVYMVNYSLRRLLKDCRYVKRTGITVADEGHLDFNDSFGRTVSFMFNAAEKTIEMNVNGGNYYTLAEKIGNLRIQYYDKLNNELASPVALPANIHSFKITVEGSQDLLSYKNNIIVFPREMFR